MTLTHTHTHSRTHTHTHIYIYRCGYRPAFGDGGRISYQKLQWHEQAQEGGPQGMHMHSSCVCACLCVHKLLCMRAGRSACVHACTFKPMVYICRQSSANTTPHYSLSVSLELMLLNLPHTRSLPSTCPWTRSVACGRCSLTLTRTRAATSHWTSLPLRCTRRARS